MTHWAHRIRRGRRPLIHGLLVSVVGLVLAAQAVASDHDHLTSEDWEQDRIECLVCQSVAMQAPTVETHEEELSPPVHEAHTDVDLDLRPTVVVDLQASPRAPPTA